MKKSHFIYGVTVGSGALTNRGKECEKLKSNLYRRQLSMIDFTAISATAILFEYRTEGHSPLLVIGGDFEKYIIKNDKGRNIVSELIIDKEATKFLAE